MLQQVADLLKKHKEKHDIYDYTDSLEKIVYEDIDVPRLKVVIVDEAQDLTKLQWALVMKLINQADKVYIAEMMIKKYLIGQGQNRCFSRT